MADPGGEGAPLKLVGTSPPSEPTGGSNSESTDSATEHVDPMLGRVVDGRYRFDSVLGEGGMGIVYRATHIALNKSLAIKVLRPEVSKNDEIVARFKQEAQSASAIGNQHIIDISDFGRMPDGATYFVMEFLEGQSLTQAIETDGFDTARTVFVAKQLCSALGAAHEVGIVHRDMKPDNVQLIPRGGTTDFVKVLDFGIAKVGGSTSKLTQAGQVFGTPHYMAPEQCAGAQVDARTDVYAVGVILYEMATGSVPFDADNLMGILTKHLYENPVPPHELPPPVDVAPALEAVILKALAKKAEHRYQSMAELSADLDAVARGTTPQAVVDRVDRQGLTTERDLPIPDEAPGRLTLGVGQPAIPTRARWPWVVGLLAVVAGGAALVFMGEVDEQATASSPTSAPIIDEASGAGETAAAVAGGGLAAGDDPTDLPEGETPAAGAPEAEVDAVGTAPTEEPAEPTKPAEPAVKGASVKVTSVPAGAQVFDGDRLLGTTPLTVAKPSRGKLSLQLRKNGYRTGAVALRSGSPKTVRVRLRAQPRVQPRDPAPKPSEPTAVPAPTEPAPTEPSSPRPKPPKPPKPDGRLQSEVLDPWQ